MSEVPEGLEVAATNSRPVRPSASLMLTRDSPNGLEVLLCHRVEELPAFPGYWAFSGGGISRVDRAAADEIFPEMSDRDLAASLIGMQRELCEELGFVINSGKLEMANDSSRDRVLQAKEGWFEENTAGNLPCSSAINTICMRTTPNFSPMRFANRFMHFHAGANVPEPILSGQTEFDAYRWDRPSNFLAEWRQHAIKIPPPIITILQELQQGLEIHSGDMSKTIEDISNNTSERSILFAHGVECVPVPTHTLPPSSTTNTYIIGAGGDHIIVDAAARTRIGLEKISRAITRIELQGGRIVGLLFTHRHLDHVGDIGELQKLGPFPIMASSETAAAISGRIDRILVDGDKITLASPEGDIEWQVLVTPGHCDGHICLLSKAGLVAGDMVAGIGTILIPPQEGSMEDYLEQLGRLKSLQPHLMFPSHGVILPLPQTTLEHYISHRMLRHEKVLEAVKSGITSLDEIATIAYDDSPEANPILAQQQTLSHLLSHHRAGKVENGVSGWYCC